MLYSFKNQYPQPLPHRIVLPNGQTRTDPSTFTEQEIIAAGYIAVENPPQVEYPNILEWANTGWTVRPPNENETQQQLHQIQQQCRQMLFDTDYKIIKAIEQGTPIDPEVSSYRQQLRDIYNNTTDPWNVSWPTLSKLHEDRSNEMNFTENSLEIIEVEPEMNITSGSSDIG